MAQPTVDMGNELPIPSGRIAYWAFDEGSGTTANDSEGTHNATLENGAAWVEGKAGQGISFDGVDDFVNVPDDAAFDFGTGDFTITAWFKTTSDKDQHIVNFRQNDNDPHIELYATVPPFGYLGTHLLPGDTRLNNDGRVDDGAWHHAAVTLQNGATDGYRLYLDGVQVAQTTYTGVLEDWDTIHIGNADESFPRWWDGAIDEVMIFDRSLSDTELTQVYEHGSR